MRWRPALRWSLIATAALVLAAALAPAALPIYDGIGNPDEPYRYVNPPPGYRTTQPPATATAKLTVSTGRTPSVQINTAEYGPQLALFLPPGALAPPVGATSVTVTAAPTMPPHASPSDGTIVGNVYRITATAPGGTVDLIGFGNDAAVLDMRAPTAQQPGPVFEHFDNGRWTSYETVRIGNDVYRTRADALGDWALVRRTAASAGSGSRSLTLSLAGGLGVCGLVLAVFAIRRNRTRGPGSEVNQ